MTAARGAQGRTVEIERAGRILGRECRGTGWRLFGEQRHGVWEWTVSETLDAESLHWLRMAVVEDYPDHPSTAPPWLTVEIWEGLQRGDRFGRRRLCHLTIEGWSMFEGAVLTFRSTMRRRFGEPDDMVLQRRIAPPLPSPGDRPDAERPLASELWLSSG